jgi:hypothetical protein
MRCWLFSAILIFCGVSSGQEPTQLQPTELRLADSHQLTMPSFMSFGPEQCDSDGNLYFRPVAASGIFNDSTTLLRLNPKTELPTLYDLPSDLVGKMAPIDYNVTHSGHVWLLVQVFGSNEYVVLGFDSNGKVRSRIPIGAPSKIHLEWFNVADDDIILLAGYYGDLAPKEMQGRPFLALFDQNGNVRKTLASDELNAVDLDAASKGPVEGGVASGSDGNFYVLQRGEILVISEWGQIVRRMKFVLPEQGMQGERIELADGFVSIHFVRLDKNNRTVRSDFLVLYSATGAPYALYTRSEELEKSLPICYLGRSGYLFQASDHGRVKLLTVAPH